MILVLYGPNSLFGRALNDLGIQVVFTPIAILIALCTVTLPMVVRTVQPVLQELDPAEEEAAWTLGARGTTTSGGWSTPRSARRSSRARC